MDDNIEHIVDSMIVGLYDRIKFLNKPNRTKLTDREAMILKHTWKTYLGGKCMIEKGMELIKIVMEKDPEIKKYINLQPTYPVNQLITSGKRMFLAHRFALLLDHFVSNVGKLEDIYATIKHVGARHGEGGYGVTPEHMKMQLNVILEDVRHQLSASWTTEKEQVWHKFLDFLFVTMEEGAKEYPGKCFFV